MRFAVTVATARLVILVARCLSLLGYVPGGGRGNPREHFSFWIWYGPIVAPVSRLGSGRRTRAIRAIAGRSRRRGSAGARAEYALVTRLCYDFGLYADAAEHARRALEALGRIELFVAERARALSAGHRWGEAAEAWRELAHSRESAVRKEAYGECAVALVEQGAWEEAEELLREAIGALSRSDEPRDLVRREEWELQRARLRVARGTGEAQTALEEMTVTYPDSERRRVATSPGDYRVWVTRAGLLITGKLFSPVRERRTVLCLDGAPMAGIPLPRRMLRSGFKYHIRPSTLEGFPKECRLSLRIGARPLLTTGGHAELHVGLPLGDGTLLERVKEGERLNKKGILPSSGTSVEGNEEQILRAYEGAREAFAELFGRELFALYGTLLGCYRDRRLIRSDDDIDLGVVVDASGPIEAKEEALGMMRKLLWAGWDVWVNRNGRLFWLAVDGVMLRVYPLWFAGGRAWAYTAVRAKRGSFLPCKSIEVYGRYVLIPAETEQLLRRTYGRDWRTPRSSFAHKRSRAVRRELDRMCVSPWELDMLVRENERERAENPGVGLLARNSSGEWKVVQLLDRRTDLRHKEHQEGAMGAGSSCDTL